MSNHRGHKKTMNCPIKGCIYTSRALVSGADFPTPKQDKWMNESKHCPVHQKELVYKQKQTIPLFTNVLNKKLNQVVELVAYDSLTGKYTYKPLVGKISLMECEESELKKLKR